MYTWCLESLGSSLRPISSMGSSWAKQLGQLLSMEELLERYMTDPCLPMIMWDHSGEGKSCWQPLLILLLQSTSGKCASGLIIWNKFINYYLLDDYLNCFFRMY